MSDDGRGGADPGAGFGLVGLKDRVEALGGRFSVQTAPDAGTTVHAELPLRGPADEAGLLDWSPAASSARGGRRFVRGRRCPVGGDAVGDVASVLVEEAE